MSNFFPKYKKSHTLPTTLLGKNKFLFSLPINLSHSSALKQPRPQSLETPSPGAHTEALGTWTAGGQVTESTWLLDNSDPDAASNLLGGHPGNRSASLHFH